VSRPQRQRRTDSVLLFALLDADEAVCVGLGLATGCSNSMAAAAHPAIVRVVLIFVMVVLSLFFLVQGS
jgi:Ni,Fe-hydrogenase I small subunit